MSTQCRYCGEAVRPDSMFCPACGQLIGAVGGAVPPFPGRAPAANPESPSAPAAPAPTLAPVPLPAPRPASGAKRPEPARRPSTKAPSAGAAAAEAPAAAKPAAKPAPAVPTAVVLPDGRRLDLDRVLVFGRSPEQGAPAHDGVPVRLDDPGRAMSRVHLVLRPVNGAVTATDPGSANGTLLERDGVQYALVAGTASALVPGDRLLLGDVTLSVV
ncbi:RDD domain containing protein [Microbacterium sp. HM58-2]|nr:RDD domain containing protein [Microbacterium sp. HM58-2]